MRYGVCIGINDYGWISADACLRGCVNDAREWASVLLDCFGYADVSILLDRSATPQGLRSALSRIAERAVDGDTVAITYSGHGTRVPDASGDEEDGYDEAIVLYGETYTDDMLNGDLKMFGPGIRVAVVADSCHSGTVLRGLLGPRTPYPPIPRYVDLLAREPDPPRRTVLRKRFGRARGLEPNRVLLAGCRADQTSADAWLAGEYHGALSFHATRLLREKPWMSWREYGKLVRQCVARTSAQIPQVEAPAAAMDAPAFA